VATLSEIRDAIADRLATLDSVRIVQEFAGPIPVSGNASVAVVEYAGATYDSAFDRAGDALNFGIIVLASKASDRGGRAKLDAICDPTPTSTTAVRTAVNGSLAGIVAFAVVRSSSGYQEYEIEGQAYLGVEFVVQVET